MNRAVNCHAFSVRVTHFGAISHFCDEASVSHAMSQCGVKIPNPNDVSSIS